MRSRSLRTLAGVVPLLAVAPALPAQGGAPAAGQESKPGTEIVVPGVRRLTIGGQYRLRYENRINFDFDDSGGSAGDSDFFTQRVRLQFGIDFTEDLAALVQVQDAREWGEETDTFDDDADGLDLHQAWVEVRRTPVVGGTTRLGRQELSYGDQRLVGPVDWRTQARSFDALLESWMLGEHGKLDAFAAQTRETLDGINDDQWFGGLYGSGPLDTDRQTTADLYLLVLHDDGVAVGGTHNRFTLGTRLLYDVGSWEVGTELATQFGEQAGADIPVGKTWALHLHAVLRLDAEAKEGLRPWIRGELNLASGDDPDTADDERFNNLFPTAHAHWGMMDLVLWENILNPMLLIGCRPAEQGELTASWNYFRSMEETDRVGGPNGTLSPGGAGFSNTLGNELDFVYTHRLSFAKDVRSALQVGYGVFLPGAGVEDAHGGTADVAHFVYTQFQIAF